MKLSDLEKISSYEWKIGEDYSPAMRVPVIVYANEAIISQCLNDQSLDQAINATKLPGVVRI